jgi:tRNA (mo5U34)-methyltransferase
MALPADLRGLSVLDIGAWDGFFSFECERRGAERVVAMDSFSWGGPGWGTKAGFDLARHALGSKVDALVLDVMDLSPERVGSFDVVLFLGVLYHLREPLAALERVAAVTEGLLILETVVDLMHVRRPAMAFYPNTELNRDPTNWWAPNPLALEEMLRDVGLAEISIVTPPSSLPRRIAQAAKYAVQERHFRGAVDEARIVLHARR